MCSLSSLSFKDFNDFESELELQLKSLCLLGLVIQLLFLALRLLL